MQEGAARAHARARLAHVVRRHPRPGRVQRQLCDHLSQAVQLVCRRFLMRLSSGVCDRRCCLIAPSVTQESPQHVDTLACEGHDGLAVSFAFRSLAVVVAAGLVTAADADQHGGVEDELEASAAAGGPVQVAADLPGVACDGGDAGEPVGADRQAQPDHPGLGRLLPGRGLQRGVRLAGQPRVEAGLQVGQAHAPEQAEGLDDSPVLRPVQRLQAGPVGVRRPGDRSLSCQVRLDKDRQTPAGHQGRVRRRPGADRLLGLATAQEQTPVESAPAAPASGAARAVSPQRRSPPARRPGAAKPPRSGSSGCGRPGRRCARTRSPSIRAEAALAISPPSD
jgi:hypothetical protein